MVWTDPNFVFLDTIPKLSFIDHVANQPREDHFWGEAECLNGEGISWGSARELHGRRCLLMHATVYWHRGVLVYACAQV